MRRADHALLAELDERDTRDEVVDGGGAYEQAAVAIGRLEVREPFAVAGEL